MKAFAARAILFFLLIGWDSAESHERSKPALSNSISSPNYLRSYPHSLVILDAGHGGVDEGTKVHSFKEKKITLITALYAKKFLEEMGYSVLLTRGKDVFVSLPKRVSIANKIKSALFVSIHFNASKNPVAQGIEIYYYQGKDATRAQCSRRLANCILHQVIDQTEAVSRGVKTGNFHVIRETQMPSVLLEGGFVTNPQECKHLKQRSYLEHIGKGVAQGIHKYLRA